MSPAMDEARKTCQKARENDMHEELNMKCVCQNMYTTHCEERDVSDSM